MNRLTPAGLGSEVSERSASVEGIPSADRVVVCRDPPYARVAIGSVIVTYGFETEGKEDGEDWYSVADTTFWE
jgi:hypothetical protein